MCWRGGGRIECCVHVISGFSIGRGCSKSWKFVVSRFFEDKTSGWYSFIADPLQAEFEYFSCDLDTSCPRKCYVVDMVEEQSFGLLHSNVFWVLVKLRSCEDRYFGFRMTRT